MHKILSLVLIIISNQVFCSDFESAHIKAIDSVTEIQGHLDDHGIPINGETLFVIDADETIARAHYMPHNWEIGRQYKRHMSEIIYAFAQSIEKTIDDKDMYKRISTVMCRHTHFSELTENAWVPFLNESRTAGAKIIIVSSRSFADSHEYDPQRIPFFEDLDFKKADLLYANHKKDKRINEWLTAQKALGHEFKNIVFIDNLMKHCNEIIGSPELSDYTRIAFEHNAYKNYFEKYYRNVLMRQLGEAYRNDRAMTDVEILSEAITDGTI
jgi:hypothetical protein